MEQKLEDTLESLEPSKSFTRSVLMALPLFPKGAAGAGGLLALLAKLSAGLSFALWTGLLQSSLTSGMVYLHFRADAANIKDKPENAHIRKNIMRNGLIVVASMGTVMLIMPLFMFYFNVQSIFKVVAVLQLLATVRMARRLRVNTSPFMISDVFGWVAMTGATAGMGFFNAPVETWFIMAIVMSFVGFFTNHRHETRHDARLLLGATGDLSREQLRALAKYLGSYGYGIDYYFQGDCVVLVIPEVRPSFAAQLSKRLSSGSRLILRPDGTCIAHYSVTDLKSLQEVHNMEIDAQAAESGLCGKVQQVLQALRRNDLQAATSILAPPLDENVFKRDPSKLRHWQVQFIVVILLLMGFLIWVRSGTGHWFHFLPKGNWLQLIKGK